MPEPSVADERAASRGCRWSREQAERVIQFIQRYYCHSKGRWAGKPLILERWQVDMLSRLFGWLRPDGTRRYRQAYISMGRKSGKSALSAAIALYMLAADNEPGAQVFSMASDRAQASLIFKDAVAAVNASPALRQHLRPYRSEIRFDRTASYYRVLSSDGQRAHGLSPHCGLYDEIWAAKTDDLWEAIVTGVGARTQPLIAAIGTAGWDRNSIAYRLYQHARGVQSGLVDDDSFFPCVYELGEEDDWADEDCWRKALPNLDVSVDREFIRSELAKAKASPQYRNSFLRLYMNRWTEAETSWVDPARWRNCARHKVDPEKLVGRRCYGGLDLATVEDMAAFVLVFEPAPGEDFTPVLSWSFLPGDNLAKRMRELRMPLNEWERQGTLVLTPGEVIDHDAICRKIVELREKYDFSEINYDRYGATHITGKLMEHGITTIPFGQGFLSMNAPIKELQRLVIAGKLAHGDNPVLGWQVNNVVVEEDASGNVKFSKGKSREKIDNLVAMAMAMDRLMRNTGVAKLPEYVFTGL